MSQRPPSTNYYAVKIKQIITAVFPDQGGIPGALSSVARGASVALAAVVVTSAFLAVVLLISEKTSDLTTILLSGAALTISSFGALLMVEPSLIYLPSFGPEVSFGFHSITVAAIAFAVVYSMSKRAAKQNNSLETSELSPFHVALGFTAMTLGVSYAAQGVATTSIGQVSFHGMTIFSALIVFALVWAVSYAGKIRGRSSSSDFEYVWKWITKALINFVSIYTVLIVFALIVLFIRNLIEPTYAVASEPVAMNINLSPDQGLWIFAGFILYGANLLIQFFLLAMGLNLGFDLQGTRGLSEVLGPFDTSLIGNATQWMFNVIGPWGYSGVLALVALVALVSGAKAADQVGAKFHGVSSYLKALFIGLFASLSVVFLAGIQLSVEVIPKEGEAMSSSFVWGASSLAVVAFGTIFIFLAHQSSGRAFDFLATAFPRLVQGKRDSGLRGEVYPGARLFGIVAIAAILLVAAVPIVVSSTNRIGAIADGPTQVGERISKTLTSASIKELKEFLNPNARTAYKWLPDKVLVEAQPVEGYSSRISVENHLGKSWQPGNLDAAITIELEKNDRTISKTIDTTSTLETNGLVNHVTYTPIISLNTLEITLSKFLKGKNDVQITLNGEKIKPGTYFAIPGVYKAKSSQYKLVAASESNVYFGGQNELVEIGSEVALPKGGAAKLDQVTKTKADKCMEISKNGEGTCVTRMEIVSSGKIGAQNVPKEYFDFRDYNFISGQVTCSNANRSDSLLSSSSEVSKTDCQTTVSFNRDYYKTAKRQVPNYITSQVCVGARVSPNGSVAHLYNYNYEYDDWVYLDEKGIYWWEEDTTYDSCAFKQSRTVRHGTKTELFRGSKISTLKLTSNISESITVRGTLLENGAFEVKP